MRPCCGGFAIDPLAPGTYRLMIDTREVARITITPQNGGMADVGKIQVRAQ